VPLRKVRISATTATADHFLFSGYVNDYRYTFPVGQETAYVDILCTDGFRLLQMSNIATVADTAAGQTTGTRINKILDDVQFPNSMRSIATGDATCIADTGTVRTTLDAIKNAEFSEGLGAFYLSPDGTAVYKSRSEVTASLADTAIALTRHQASHTETLSMPLMTSSSSTMSDLLAQAAQSRMCLASPRLTSTSLMA
jgi:hypothetical protein